LIILGTQIFLSKHPKATIPVYIALGISAALYFLAFFFYYLNLV
jgi:hypothetical protein